MIEQKNDNSLIVKDQETTYDLTFGEHTVTTTSMFHVFAGRLQIMQTNYFSAKRKRQQNTMALLTREETIALRDLLNSIDL